MNITMVTRYVTSDRKEFDYDGNAIEHQKNLSHEALDTIMRMLGEEDASIHYRNLSLKLIPFMVDNSYDIIKALKLADLMIEEE